MIDEMSSGATVEVAPGRTYGVPHAESPPTVWLTQTLSADVHVAHRRPVESLAITSVSVSNPLIATGKPPSGTYLFAAAS
jgi:hypothetical protein